jgi:tight adherence protein B
MEGLLPLVLLMGACLSLLGLGFSGYLVSRSQAQSDRQKQRLTSIVAPHLRSARVEVTAFTDGHQQEGKSFLQTMSWLFGFDLEKTALYPSRWWVILAGTLIISRVCTYFAAAFLGSASLAALPVVWVVLSRNTFKWFEARRQKQLLVQFPDTLAMIVRSIRVGIPVLETIRMISREQPEPTASCFGQLLDQVGIGVSLPDGVIELARRSGLPEYRFFATALALQNQTGGTLSDTLENLADVIRKRAALRAKGHAMTSEARTSALILAAIPVLVGLLLYFMNPAYIMILFTTDTGRSLFGAAVMSLAMGMLSIRVIIKRTLA